MKDDEVEDHATDDAAVDDGAEPAAATEGASEQTSEAEEEDAFGTFDALQEAADKTPTAQKLLTVLTNELPLCHNKEKADALVRRLVDLHVCACASADQIAPAAPLLFNERCLCLNRSRRTRISRSDS
jgi:hypothetical protein